jgi:gamma-glutamylputrescine oxidase
MRLLYDNDVKGRYASALYTQEAGASQRSHTSTLQAHLETDAVVVGAGFTGLSAALHLAEAGKDVMLLEAHRAGWGASGRNGGQLGSGYNTGPNELVAQYGLDKAQALWQFAESAKDTVHSLCKQHDLNIDYAPGIVMAAHRRRHVAALHTYVEGAQQHFGYDKGHTLDAAEMRAHVASDLYHGGLIDHGAGHINPLKLALGLSDAALNSGVQLFEQSPAIRIEPVGETWRVVTPSGSVTARHLVFATNGYHDDLLPELTPHVMPINSFVVATEPLGELAEALLPSDAAIADTRFVVGYFRRSRDGRLIYGGGEGYRYRFPRRPEERVRRSLGRVFPELRGRRFTHAWGGTLSITPSRMPFVREVRPRLLAAGGYSGHGVALSIGCGTALARAINGDREALELLSTIEVGRFPGGRRTRPWLLAAAMGAAALGDLI